MRPTKYLLDTAAVSEAVKSSKDKGYMNWLNSNKDENLYISCLTIGEIQKGVSLVVDQNQLKKLEAYLAGLYEAFGERILDLNVDDAARWGKLIAKAQKFGATAPVIDSLLAAQCLNNNMVLVTRNVKDFEQFDDLKILCPWSK